MNLKQDSTLEVIAERTTISDNKLSDPALPTTGDPVELFWELDNKFNPEIVSSISPAGQLVIKYDEGEMELSIFPPKHGAIKLPTP